MKLIFAETKSKEKLSKEIIDEIAKAIPKKIAIFSSIQYIEQAKQLENELKSKGKIIIKEKEKKTKNSLSKYPNQILGCDISKIMKIKNKTQAFLILGSKFHSFLAAIKSGKETFFYSEGKLEKISKEEINSIKAKQKTALIKFYSSDKVGILVSIKPGQENLKLAEKINEKLKKLNKQGIIFITDNINLNEFENFPIDIYVNTACPTLIFDSNKIINFNEIPELINQKN